VTEEEAALKAAGLQAQGFEVRYGFTGIQPAEEDVRPKGPKDWSPKGRFRIRRKDLVITGYFVRYRKPGTDEWERA